MICTSVSCFFTSDLLSGGSDSTPGCYSRREDAALAGRTRGKSTPNPIDSLRAAGHRVRRWPWTAAVVTMRRLRSRAFALNGK